MPSVMSASCGACETGEYYIIAGLCQNPHENRPLFAIAYIWNVNYESA